MLVSAWAGSCGTREHPRAGLQCEHPTINVNTEKPQNSKYAGMWLELFWTNFTVDAQELGKNSFPVHGLLVLQERRWRDQ